jgi:hypothetical protein
MHLGGYNWEEHVHVLTDALLWGDCLTNFFWD